jgi:hypothetical protein
MARLDRLGPVKEIAQIGAVIGRDFSYELIAAIVATGQAHLDGLLAQLTSSGLAFRTGMPPDAVYTFKHALVQDAAYDSLAQEPQTAIARQDCASNRERFPSITTPSQVCWPITSPLQVSRKLPFHSGERRRTGVEAHGSSRGHTHLNAGLGEVAALPLSSSAEAERTGLRTLLGTAWLALKGWAAPEVWTSLHPHSPWRSRSSETTRCRHPLGLWINVQCAGASPSPQVGGGNARHREIER